MRLGVSGVEPGRNDSTASAKRISEISGTFCSALDLLNWNEASSGHEWQILELEMMTPYLSGDEPVRVRGPFYMTRLPIEPLPQPDLGSQYQPRQAGKGCILVKEANLEVTP